MPFCVTPGGIGKQIGPVRIPSILEVFSEVGVLHCVYALYKEKGVGRSARFIFWLSVVPDYDP